MNNDYTHVTYVIDRSGSMATVWADTLGGLKQFISDQKKEPGKCTLSLYAFDNLIETPLDFSNIGIVSESVEDFGIAPRGGTALYDAIGKAVTETGAKLAAISESERPGKVLVVVQTDGEENSSREYRSAAIQALIKEQETKYNWQFMFIGASLASVTSATRDLGFSAQTTTFYDVKNTSKYHGMLNSKVSALRSAKSSDAVFAAMSYSDDERKELAE